MYTVDIQVYLRIYCNRVIYYCLFSLELSNFCLLELPREKKIKIIIY